MSHSIKKIGILGTGNAGKTLGEALKKAGYDIVLGSRQPQIFTDNDLTVKSLKEAAEHGDLIVNATPGEVTLDVLRAIGSDPLRGKVLLDVSVGLTADYSSVFYQVESGGELIQAEFPEVKVVKSLCTMTSTIMVKPDLLKLPTTVFLSGNDAEAKKTVGKLLFELGWSEDSQLDLGEIETARGQEHFAMMYFALAKSLNTADFNISVQVSKHS